MGGKSGSETGAAERARTDAEGQTSGQVSSKVIVIAVDTTVKERFFASSEVLSLRDWEATEAELYNAVLELYPKYSVERIFTEGAQMLARRKIADAHSVKLRGQKSRSGSADKRLEREFLRLVAVNAKAGKDGSAPRKITAWTLSEAAKTSWKTAARWLKDNEALR